MPPTIGSAHRLLQGAYGHAYARKHLAGAPSSGHAHHGSCSEPQTCWQDDAAAPISAAVSSSQALSMRQWPGSAATAPQPPAQGGRGGGQGGGKGGSRGGARGAASNITASYGPPQPQKPTTQISLKEALSRHAKAKGCQQEPPQAEPGEQQQAEQSDEPRALPLEGATQPGPAPLLSVERAPMLQAPEAQPEWPGLSLSAQQPQQQQQAQQAQQPQQQQQQQQGAPKFGWQLPPGGTRANTQGTVGSMFVAEPSRGPAAAAAGGQVVTERLPAPTRQLPSIPGALGNRVTSPWTTSLQPLSSGNHSLPLPFGTAAAPPSLALGKPPLAPARPAGSSARASVSAAAAVAAGRWAPGPAAPPTAGSGEPGGKEERRLRLQRLLCDSRDPFEPASTGRWEEEGAWAHMPSCASILVAAILCMM